MNQQIEERSIKTGLFIAENKSTVRNAANILGMSKSTVHKDVTERLIRLNRNLAKEVKAVLDTNKRERHIRGGEATKAKYLLRK